MAKTRKQKFAVMPPAVGKFPEAKCSEIYPLSSHHLAALPAVIQPQHVVIAHLTPPTVTLQEVKVPNVQAICTIPEERRLITASLAKIGSLQLEDKKIKQEDLTCVTFLTETEIAQKKTMTVKSIIHCSGTRFIAGILAADTDLPDELFLFDLESGKKYFYQSPQPSYIIDICFVVKNHQPTLLAVESGTQKGVFCYDICFDQPAISARTHLINEDSVRNCRTDQQGRYLAISKKRKLQILRWDDAFALHPVREYKEPFYSVPNTQFMDDSSLLFLNLGRRPRLVTQLQTDSPIMKKLDSHHSHQVCALPEYGIFSLRHDSTFLLQHNWQAIYQEALENFHLALHKKVVAQFFLEAKPFSIVTHYFKRGFFQAPDKNIPDDKEERAATQKMLATLIKKLPANHVDQKALAFFQSRLEKEDHGIQMCVTETIQQKEFQFSKDLMMFLQELAQGFQLVSSPVRPR